MRRDRHSFVCAFALGLTVQASRVLADPPANESSTPSANVVIGTAVDAAPASPPPVAAPAAPATWIFLRDGTRLSGRVTALEANRFVVIELQSGQPRTIAWNDMVRAGGAAFPSGYVAYALPPPMVQPGSYESAGGNIPIEFSSTGEQVTISPGFVMNGGRITRAFSMRGRMLCRTPCIGFAEAGPTLFTVQGATGRQVTFHVDVGPSGSRVVIRPATRGFDALSITLDFSAPAIFATGWALVIYGFANNYGSPTRSMPFFVGGGVLAASGFLATVASLVMWFSNRPILISAEPREPSLHARWSGGVVPLAEGGAIGSFGATF